jgi:hypothetical protein
MASRFDALNLIALRIALDRHNARCPIPARAILLNPVDHGLMGWDRLWGLPVLGDQRVDVKRIRIDCDGSAASVDEELAELLKEAEEGGQFPPGPSPPL